MDMHAPTSTISSSSRSPAPSRVIDGDGEAEMLRRLWKRHREDVARRVDVLARAVAVLHEGHGDPVIAREGQAAAHTLAGSLGMFGFREAGEAAADLERKLEPGHDGGSADLCDALARLRADIAREPPGAGG